MAEKLMTPPTCCQCSISSVAICVTCNRHFCWEHLNQHRRFYEEYLDNLNQPLATCLNEYETIENRLRSDIDQWENETKTEVNNSADKARQTLDAYIHSYRAYFNDESAHIRNASSTFTNRQLLLHRLEKLQLDYGRSLSELRLFRHYDRGQMLEIETKNATREQVTISGSSQVVPQESDMYVAQTALGDRLIKEPLTKVPVGSYWAMGGSNEQLLVQEYEKKQLVLFDRSGSRVTSMTWHYDSAIRDINWYEDMQRFFILLDKKLILFNPQTKHFQEITNVKPYQTTGFRRCTCERDRLFIVYWGQESLIELIRISNWETEQRWLSPVTCQANELIGCIRLNSLDQLGLCIQDENNPLCRKFRFEIRDLALNKLYTLPLIVDSGIFSRMTALPDLHWALLNVDENYIFVINQQGELIDKIEWPRGPISNIALIGDHTFIIRTGNKIYFYDIHFQDKE